MDKSLIDKAMTGIKKGDKLAASNHYEIKNITDEVVTLFRLEDSFTQRWLISDFASAILKGHFTKI